MSKALRHLLPVAGTLAVTLLLSACSLPGARYNVHVGNTVALREADLGKVKIGQIRKDPKARADVDKVKARASPVVSPYGSYTNYLREALLNEFDHADLVDPAAAVSIDGVLLKNQLGGSLDQEFALLEAQLTVTRDGSLVYQAVKSARYEWQSTFLGAIAIPRAIANYQVGVQRLIAAFIADPQFVAALKKR